MYRSVKVVALIIGLIAAQVSAESLWMKSSTSMCEDQKAKRVGDVLTIQIVEGSTSSVAAGTSYDKSFDHNNGAAVGPFPLNLLPNMNMNSAQKGSSKGTNTITSSFTTNLTATVTAVQPNGNLDVVATRTVETNGEKQEITLTGSVRPQDIGTDNTVQSTFLSNVNINYKGKGPIGDRAKEGFISKFLKFIF